MVYYINIKRLQANHICNENLYIPVYIISTFLTINHYPDVHRLVQIQELDN